MKKTKRSLFISIVTLLLCSAMFVGSTFAWFTDTVSNTGNKIQAGTLKIDLLQDKGGEEGYVSIKDQTTPVFNSGEETGLLWEPGQTQVAYLAIENKGNLALKYNIILDVVDRETNEDLTEAMAGAFTFAIVNTDHTMPTTKFADWNSIKTKEGVTPVNLLDAIHAAAQSDTAKSARITAAPNGKLLAGEKDYFVIAIHMNETAGNAYQNGLIEFDVNVVATQQPYEQDGFGSNEYDAGAEFDEVAKRIEGKPSYHQTQETINQLSDTSKVELTIESGSSLTAEVSGREAKAQLANILDRIPTEKRGAVTDTTLDLTLNVKTTEAKPEFIALDISMDGVVTTTKKETGKEDVVTTEKVAITNTTDLTVVKLVLEKNIKDIKVTHSGVPMNEVASDSSNEGFFFNKSTSTLTIQTKSFSPYTISYTKEYVEPGTIKVYGSNDLKAALNEIKTNPDLYDKPVKIVLAPSEDKYRDKFDIYQYPKWNGVYGNGSSGNNMVNPNVPGYESYKTTAKTMVTITAEAGTVFGGSFTVKGYGYSQGADPNFTTDEVYTKFEGITFDQSDWNTHANGILSEKTLKSGSIWQPITGAFASSNVLINNCKFIHTGRIQNGNPDKSGGYSYKFKMSNCTFTETDSVIQGYMHGSDAIMLDNITANDTESFLVVTGGGESPIKLNNCRFSGIGHFIRIQVQADVYADNCVINIAEPTVKDASEKSGRVASVVTYRSLEDGKSPNAYLNNCAIIGYKQIVFGEDKTSDKWNNGFVKIINCYADEAKTLKLNENDFHVFKGEGKTVIFTVE